MSASQTFFSYLALFGMKVFWGVVLGLLIGLIAIYAYFKDKRTKKKVMA